MRKADNLPPYCAVVKKSRSLNFLDRSGPPMACNGSALPLPVSSWPVMECKFTFTVYLCYFKCFFKILFGFLFLLPNNLI